VEADRRPSGPSPRKRFGRAPYPALALLVLLFPCLTGFVPGAQKLLEKNRAAVPAGPAVLSVTLNGEPGRLEVGLPGTHRFTADSGERRADPGPSADDPTGLKALWRLLDLFADQPPELLETVLAEAGVDVYRTGWVRLDPGGERVAATLGALGESEPEMPQVWFDREVGRVVRVTLGDGSEAVVGPPGPKGWPLWIGLGRAGRLDLLSEPARPDRR